MIPTLLMDNPSIDAQNPVIAEKENLTAPKRARIVAVLVLNDWIAPQSELLHISPAPLMIIIIGIKNPA